MHYLNCSIKVSIKVNQIKEIQLQPVRLRPGVLRVWAANVENAPGAVSYEWFVSDDANVFTWSSTGVTSQSFTWTFFNDTTELQSRGIRVVISSNSETKEAVKFISVGPGAEECQPGELICS